MSDWLPTKPELKPTQPDDSWLESTLTLSWGEEESRNPRPQNTMPTAQATGSVGRGIAQACKLLLQPLKRRFLASWRPLEAAHVFKEAVGGLELAHHGQSVFKHGHSVVSLPTSTDGDSQCLSACVYRETFAGIKTTTVSMIRKREREPNSDSMLKGRKVGLQADTERAAN